MKRILQLLGMVLLATFTGMLVQGWRSFGHAPDTERLARMEKSPQWQSGHFENPQPLRNDMLGALAAMFKTSSALQPAAGIPVIRPQPTDFQTPAPSGLRVTWFGHSSTLVEIENFRILTDPVFSERTSPYTWLGPKRWYAPPVAQADLPAIDAVVISHDHYDHLDMGTIIAMQNWKTIFIVPLGIGAHLAYWGIPEHRIIELDWWQEKQLTKDKSSLRIVMTPARHASGRMLVDNNSKLWAGYAFIGTKRRVYFSGDTGLFPAMKDIGKKFGPFDLTMIEVGQYHRTWPDWHIGPEQAVKAHQWVRGRVMLPIHWGLFVLAAHGWTEPIERVSKEAERLKVTLATPKPGQSFETDDGRDRRGRFKPTPTIPTTTKWWPSVEWQTAQEHPIQSTQVEEK